MYDIAIVGGGPAGATLARLTGGRYRILLLEKRTFQEPLYGRLQKCCGGLIAPDAQKMLASFGLGLPRSVILSPQMFAVRTIDMDNSLEKYYQRHYINTDREKFDQWLESLIPPSVDIINGSTYRSHTVQEDCVRIRFTREGKEYEEKAGLLVGADGAFSGVHLASFPGRAYPRRYAAIQEWFIDSQDVNYYGAVFCREITDFYAWLIPKEGNLIVGAALPPGSDAPARFALLKRKLKDYGFALNKSIRKNGTYLLRPKANQICIGGGRVALIGEAAGFISPSSAEGFSYAFKSAMALAEALAESNESWHDIYRKNTAALRANIMLKNLKSPFMYNRVLRRLIMKSGFKSIKMHVSK